MSREAPPEWPWEPGLSARAPKGYDPQAVLSEEEVLRRVDGRGSRPPRAPGGLIGTEPVERVVRVRGPRPDARVVLWRDTATILIVGVLALLGWQTFARGVTSSPRASATIPAGVALGSLPPGASLPPGVTFGPAVDPSLGIDATPTPIPVITLEPSQSPTPMPGPTRKPPPTPRPTKTPSPTPTPKPAPTLTPTSTPTPTPTPTAAFTCTLLAGLQLDCSNTSLGSIDTWLWLWGDGNEDTVANPGVHTYSSDISPVTVTLTVTGPGGSDLASHTYTLTP